MFALNIRFQIAAAFVLLLMLIDYRHNPHLKLLSNKYFIVLLTSIAINLGFDISTVFTITHLQTVPAWINRLCHQLFIASLILSMLFYYLYVSILADDQKRRKKKEHCMTYIPVAISAIIIIFGRLEYHVQEDGAYSYGMMASCIYICAVIYFGLTFKIILNKKNTLSLQQRKAIRMGLCIWLIALGIQHLWPAILVSGFAFVLLVLSTYFSFENQKDNLDTELSCFNRNAFHKVMAEYYEKGKVLFLVNVVCENYGRINTMLGHEKGIEALIYIKNLIIRNLGGEVYHSRSNVFTVFVEENISKDETKIERLAYALSQSNFKEAKLLCCINVIDVRKYTKSRDEVYELINFMTDNADQDKESIHYLNQKIVDKKVRHDKIVLALMDAIDKGGLKMYYQPIFWPKENKIKSAEALLRLKTIPELGYISPEEFIPIAEEKGLIIDIGDKVMDMVAGFIKDNKLESSELEYIEVNLSGIQAASPNIDKRLMAILDHYGVSPSFINLEITETATVNAGKSFLENMEKLRVLGFSFSMDDFGTGYSNLAQVSQMQYDLVKLDKSLIWPAFEKKEEKDQEKAVNLLSSLIKMMHKLNIPMVAEGVETEQMVEFLSESGVQHLQGYYYSKPVNKKAFLELL